MDDFEQTYDRYQSTWSRQDWAGWLDTCDPGYEFTVNGTVLGGAPTTLAWSRSIFARFPDYAHRIETVTSDGAGTVVAEAVALGSGPAGALRLPYVKVLTIVAGVVVADRQYHDQSLVPGR